MGDSLISWYLGHGVSLFVFDRAFEADYKGFMMPVVHAVVGLALSLLVLGGPAEAGTEPIPEFYGFYAIFGDQYAAFDVPASTGTPATFAVRLGQMRGLAALGGGEMAIVSQTELWLLPANVRFLLFQRASMGVPPKITVQAVSFVRNVTVDSLLPQRRRSGKEEAWDAGFPPESAGLMAMSGLAAGKLLSPIQLLHKPVAGNPEMIVAVPASPLSPGIYLASASTLNSGYYFAVGPVAEGHFTRCVDVAWEYSSYAIPPTAKTTTCSVGTSESAGLREPESAAGDGPISAWLGSWAGDVNQRGVKRPYPVRLSIHQADEKLSVGAELGRIAYPSLGCEGRVTMNSLAPPVLVLREEITEGKARCVSGDRIRLAVIREGQLSAEWLNSAEKTIARAVLAPSD